MTHRHQKESIDETIDRVAARLTMVPADPALAGRIAARLDDETRFAWPRLMMATAAAASMIVVAALVFNATREEPARDFTGVVTPAPTPPPAPRGDTPRATPTVVAPVQATAVVDARRERRARTQHDEPLPELPQIDSLPSPALLAVDTLPTDTLTIAPVALAPLDMANLAVGEIDEREPPKE